LKVPLVGIVGPSGSGKTTLLEKVLPCLKDKGLCVGVLKQAHPRFDIDHPGKDSYRLRTAGAAQMLVMSNKRWALMVETDEDKEYPIEQIIDRFEQGSLDLIVIEGARYIDVPKIEIYRVTSDHSPLYREDTSIVAVATDFAIDLPIGVQHLDVNNPVDVAQFMIERLIPSGQM